MPTRTEDAINPDVGPSATANTSGRAAVPRRRAIWWYWPPLAMLVMAGALVWFSLWSQSVPLGNTLFNHPPLYGKFDPVFTNWTLIRLVPAGLLLAIAAWVAVATDPGARPGGAPLPGAGDAAAGARAPDAQPSRRTRTAAMLTLIIASAWVTSIAVNLVRGDELSLVRGVSTTEGTYLSRDLHLIDELGVRGFVSGFPSLADHLIAWNGRTHPPGVQVFLWTLSQLVHGQPYAMTTVLAVLSLGTAVGAWGMARAYGGERAGRIAAVLAVAAPGPLMLAYTNMDAVFAAFFAGAAAFFVAGARRAVDGRRGSAVFAAIGGAVLGFATFLTYATAFLALAAGVAIVVETRSLKQSAKLLGGAVLGGAAVLLVLRLTLGFDLLACYASLTRSGARFVPYFVAGQPAAWLIWSGLPMAALGIAGLVVAVPGARRPVLPAVLIVMMIIWGALPPSVTALRQGEVERTWAFLYPMLAASAGPVVDFWTRGYRPVARVWAGGVVALLVALSVAQAGVVQSLWDNLT